jgi:hypothetical protein
MVRQLELLGRLAEAGLNIALAVERQALAVDAAGREALAPVAPGAPVAPVGAVAPAPEAGAPAAAGQVVQGDIALAYGRVSRAVRLTAALQAGLVEALQALDEGAARRRIRERADAQRAREAAAAARKARVERIVERLIREEARDEAEGDRLADEAYERLEHDDIYGDLSDRPLGEIVAMICEDLGLAPDWSRLAEEAWAREAWTGEAWTGEAPEAMAGGAAAPRAAGPRAAAPRAATIRWLDPPLADAEAASAEPAACGAGPPPAELRAASP